MDHRLAAYLEDLLGPVALGGDHSRHGRSIVEVTGADGRPWVVKTVPTVPAFRNELRAYRHWVPGFADQAPRLRGAHPDLRALVLERLPGRTAWSFHPEDHREAGRLLARIHTAAPARPGDGGLEASAAAMLARSLGRLPRAGAVSRAEVGLARSGYLGLREVGHLPEVPCHGDYGGHNWLRADDRLRVIDFSGSGWRPAVHDFARLYIGPWWERPDLVEAFGDGYGRSLADDELEAVRLLLPLFALAVLTQGLRRGNAEMTRRGRHRLQRLLAGHDFTRRAPALRRWAQGARRVGRRPVGAAVSPRAADAAPARRGPAVRDPGPRR